MSVYTKLNRARMALGKRKLTKTGLNKFAGYSYFELGDFLIPTQEIFDEVGLCGVVSFTAELATLTITDTEDGSQIVLTSPMGSAALKGCHEVQNIGAVETYQRRYLWVSAMEIVEHDALDATTGKEKPEKAPARGPVIPVAKGAMDALDEKRRNFLLDTAAYVKERFDANDILAAHDSVYEVTDDGELMALSTLIPSHIRTAIRKHHEAQKEAA
jgi:hypothetical protein